MSISCVFSSTLVSPTHVVHVEGLGGLGRGLTTWVLMDFLSLSDKSVSSYEFMHFSHTVSRLSAQLVVRCAFSGGSQSVGLPVPAAAVLVYLRRALPVWIEGHQQIFVPVRDPDSNVQLVQRLLASLGLKSLSETFALLHQHIHAITWATAPNHSYTSRILMNDRGSDCQRHDKC